MRVVRLLLCVTMAVAGCAHTVRFTSEPPGALVTIDGLPIGETPCSMNDSSAASASMRGVSITKAGYRPFNGELVRTFDWAQCGLIMAGGGAACGAINLATAGSGLGYLAFIPAAGAALFSFKSPEKLHAVLEPLPPRAEQPHPPVEVGR